MINNSIEKKNEKKYEKPCILIIFLEVDGRIFSIKEWSIIIDKITTTVNREKFVTAFVCNDSNNHVFEIINQVGLTHLKSDSIINQPVTNI
jgi:hypothetical protein